jgi:hypothetical protein
MNQNYNKIPWFVERNQNNNSNLWNIKTKFVVFYYKVLIVFPTSSKLCLIISPLPQIFPLWAVPSHIIMIQNQQEIKIENYNVP